MTLKNISHQRSSGGWHKQYTHTSNVLQCDMRFAIFLPPNACESNKVPVLYWLSGLTCTDENFMQKAGAHKLAAQLGMAIVAPDTSPRGENIPDAPDGAYDLGLGAGFYLNATQKPWSDNYQMYDYVLKELPALIEAHFPVSEVKSISGHSMGGHGALSIALKNTHTYRSVSAFSPIINPMDVPWGQKAFTFYLGEDKAQWAQYDSCALIKKADKHVPMLIDQGDADSFLHEQLKPQRFEKAAKEVGYSLELRMQEGYDHSYFFIASFIEDHLRFHAKYLDL